MKRKLTIISILVCLSTLAAYALSDFSLQNSDSIRVRSHLVSDETDSEDTLYEIVEDMPSFPGGQQALFNYLSANIKYPVEAQKNGIQGRVICSFVVDKDGSITDVEVKRSSGDPSLDKEAVRVVKSMPKWKPGKQRGKIVRVRYTIPVNFRLN